MSYWLLMLDKPVRLCYYCCCVGDMTIVTLQVANTSKQASAECVLDYAQQQLNFAFSM